MQPNGRTTEVSTTRNRTEPEGRRVRSGQNQQAYHIVSQAASRPDLELSRLRQADEGRVSPTAGGRMREGTPTASQYPLRKTQPAGGRERRGQREASHLTHKGDSYRYGNQTRWPCKGRTSGYGDGRPNSARMGTQAEKLPTLTMQLGVPTRCLLCTACYIHPNSMRTHLR